MNPAPGNHSGTNRTVVLIRYVQSDCGTQLTQRKGIHQPFTRRACHGCYLDPCSHSSIEKRQNTTFRAFFGKCYEMIVIGGYWVPVSNFHDDCCCISVDFSVRVSARSRSSIPSKVFYKIFRGSYDTDLAVSQDRVGNTPTDLSTRIAASFSSISQKTREAVGLNDWCMSFRYAFSRSLYELQFVFRMNILR